MAECAAIDFTNTFHHSLDDKGRLTLPGSVRTILDRSSRPDYLWLGWMPGESCINLYPVETMAELNAEWSDPARFTSVEQHASYLGLWKSQLETVVPDKAGRILLPPAKRNLAGIGKDVVVVGCGNKVQIWEPESKKANDAAAALAYLEDRKAERAAGRDIDPARRLPRC
ncbi:MAG: hypothetical protein LBR80_02200 [Deltaproteobacteria bacterium]|jgi:MraZ protein|nr:hypothetical protein [Deltaproteobacteria bacterium]